jgi:hypothetical protein
MLSLLASPPETEHREVQMRSGEVGIGAQRRRNLPRFRGNIFGYARGPGSFS